MTPTPTPSPAAPEKLPMLLPCPFCGVTPVIERCADTHDRLYGERKWWGIKCRSTLNLGGTCAVEINPQASIEAAVARWNTRAPALRASRPDVERIMALVDKLLECQVDEDNCAHRGSVAEYEAAIDDTLAARSALREELEGKQ